MWRMHPHQPRQGWQRQMAVAMAAAPAGRRQELGPSSHLALVSCCAPALHEMSAAATRALHGLLPSLARVPLALRTGPACRAHIEVLTKLAHRRRVAGMTPHQAAAAAAATEEQQQAAPLANPALAHSEVLLATSERTPPLCLWRQ